MTMKQWIVSGLLRLYPAAWRAEYGPELTEILLARPLGPRVLADVLWNGARQRAQAAEPSTILGLASILVVLTQLIPGAAPQPTWIILPTVGVTFLASGVLSLFQFISGFWTHLRHRGTVKRSGLAAMKTVLLAGIPLVIGALLMMMGLVDRGLPDTTFPPPSPLAMMFAPLTRLPDAWIWGALGGLLGKQITCRRQRTGAIQS